MLVMVDVKLTPIRPISFEYHMPQAMFLVWGRRFDGLELRAYILYVHL